MYDLLKPNIDFVFKRIFGNEEHPEVLISFLNSVLTHIDPIKSIVFNNTDLERKNIEDKMSRMDIKATTDKGELVNIEIQIKNQHNIEKRSLYYWSRMYSEQLKVSKDYNTLVRTICINIVDFKFLECEKYHSIFRFKDIYDNAELTDVAEIHFIELPKLKFTPNQPYANMLEKWVDFINNPENFVDEEEIEDELDIAVKELQVMSLSKKDRDLYDARFFTIIDENSRIATATQRGREEGREEGKEEGREEAKINIAKNLLDVLDNETISIKTGLSVQEIEKLRN